MGPPAKVFQAPDSLTAAYITGRMEIPIPERRRAAPHGRAVAIGGAAANNLQKIDAVFPLGVFTCVTGVSGGGKSTLVVETLYKAAARRLNGARAVPGAHRGIDGLEHLDKIIDIDQSPIGRTPRSNPATYTAALRPDPRLVRRPARIRMRAATGRAASRSTSRAGAARPAMATACSRSRCISCRTSTSSATSARASATTARPWRSPSRTSRSPTCST